MLSPSLQYDQSVPPHSSCFRRTRLPEIGMMPTSEAAHPLLMIAEDDLVLQRLLKVTLERACYRVIAVANGAEAVSTFQQHNFDLVMLDIMMPVMDGLDACAQIRNISTTIPILLLSAFSSMEVKLKAKHRGASLFLHKPIRPTDLKQHIQSLLQKPFCIQVAQQRAALK